MTLDRKILDEEAWGDVCSLSPDALRERIALVRSELMPQVVETATRSDGFSWQFEDTPELRRKLEHLVALERECCSGLGWELERLSSTRRLRLTVAGIEPGESC